MLTIPRILETEFMKTKMESMKPMNFLGLSLPSSWLFSNYFGVKPSVTSDRDMMICTRDEFRLLAIYNHL